MSSEDYEAGLATPQEGWSTHLPTFANKTNKELDVYIKRVQRELEYTDVSLEDNEDRIRVMAEHLANVQGELKYIQSRCNAKNNEIQTEGHLRQLSKRQGGRLEKELAANRNTQQQLADKLDRLHTDLYRGKEKTDQFKLVMNWNQEEFAQWALAAKQKEEDNLALQQYQQQDEVRTRDMTMQLEKLSTEALRKRADLDAEVTETQAAQIELNKTAQDFRQLHTERQDLVEQWDTAIAAMHRRDAAIQLATEMFGTKKAELRKLRSSLDSQSRFLDNEQANSHEVEARIDHMERQVHKLRDAFAAEQHALSEATDEVEIMRNTLNKTEGEWTTEQESNGHARQALEAKRCLLESLQKRCTAAQAKLEGEFSHLGSLEAKTQELESLRKVEAGRLAAVSKQLKALKAEQFKKGQQLFGLRNQERELNSEINGSNAQNRNLSHKLHKLDEKVVRQQELLYNVDFRLQMMERQVARAAGTRSDEETKQLNAKIAKLTEALEGVNAEHAMLTAQVKKAEEDLSQGRSYAAEQRKERESLEETIHSIQLESELTARALKQSVTAKEDRMVEHDVLALEAKRLKGGLLTAGQELAGLENRKAQLRFSMEERKQEIQMHKETLQAELKMVKEDIHRVTLELTERQQRVDKLHSKHDVLISRNATPDGEVHSQAYYVIKAAQEREELQREGDALDARIQTAEKEVRGLEATLAKLNLVNTDMGRSFRRVDTSEAHAERAVLREQLDRVYDALRLKRTEERDMVQDVAQAEARLDALAEDEAQLHSSLRDLHQKQEAAERQAEEQRQKHSRASKRVDKLQREIRARVSSAEPLPEEKDIQLGTLQECNAQMLQELAALASQHEQVGLAEQLQAFGLSLPSSSGLASARSSSSVSSSRSGSITPSRSTKRLTPQRSMRMSTGSIG